MMARYDAIGDLSEDGDAIADAMRAEADAIVFEATTDHGRLAGFGLGILPVPDGPARPDPDPLQHRAAGLRPVRDRARRRPGGAPRRPCRPRLGRRDPAVPPGRAARPPGSWPRRASPHTLIPDVAAGHLMARGEVDVVLVGGDRVAANGDTANKVGTYTAGRAGGPARDPVLRRAPRPARSTSRRPTARRSRSRSARPTRSSSSAASGSRRPAPRSATPPSTSPRPS